jgi:hypothetical protein
VLPAASRSAMGTARMRGQWQIHFVARGGARPHRNRSAAAASFDGGESGGSATLRRPGRGVPVLIGNGVRSCSPATKENSRGSTRGETCQLHFR